MKTILTCSIDVTLAVAIEDLCKSGRFTNKSHCIENIISHGIKNIKAEIAMNTFTPDHTDSRRRR